MIALKVHCNTLQHIATHCHTLQHTATHCNTLQRTATLCNTLQHTATHIYQFGILRNNLIYSTSSSVQYISYITLYLICETYSRTYCGSFAKDCGSFAKDLYISYIPLYIICDTIATSIPHTSYRMALVRRIDKIIGLFFKRAL